MSYLPASPRKLSLNPSRPGGAADADGGAVALPSRLRRMTIVALLVLTADFASKALLLQLSPSSTIAHYTHPNPLALLLVLAAAPLILRVINSRPMMLALGVCIGGCAGNLFERMLGHSVTDFIPLPHLLANPTCQVGHTCVLMCNVADLALWGSVPLLALAFVWHAVDGLAARRHATA